MPSEEYPPGLDNFFLRLEPPGEGEPDFLAVPLPLGDLLAVDLFFMATLLFSAGQTPLFFMKLSLNVPISIWEGALYASSLFILYSIMWKSTRPV